MNRPDSKAYQSLPFIDQARAVIQFMADSGHAVTDGEKLAVDANADKGRAAQRARVTGTVWKTATLIPTAIRKDYPRLVALAAMEEAYLASLRAEAAVRAVNAME
jgi:hypothetical protein